MDQPTFLADIRAFESRCRAAMDAVTEAIGVDAWSRDLDDHVVAYAFCVPQTVYDNDELCNDLKSWMYFMLGQNYLTAAVIEWRPSSADEDWPDNTRYEVDWCGSKSREVHLGPHLYIEFMPRLTRSKGLGIEVPVLPRFHFETETPDCYTVNVKTISG
jgi:hypothetical protein